MVEGVRLAREALDAQAQPLVALYDTDALSRTERGREVLARVEKLPRAYAATSEVVKAAADTVNPAGIVMAVAQPPAPTPEVLSKEPQILVLDGIVDAGNAGAILRSAAAAGLHTVAFAGQCVDPYSSKVVRAAMGAHFRLAILELDWSVLLPLLTTEQVVGADARASTTIYDVDWTKRTAIIVGSEAHGMSEAARSAVTLPASIPMAFGVESLNAAAVAAIILFEAARVRANTISVQSDGSRPT